MTNHIYTETRVKLLGGSSDEYCTMDESLIQLYCNRLNDKLKPKDTYVHYEDISRKSR